MSRSSRQFEVSALRTRELLSWAVCTPALRSHHDTDGRRRGRETAPRPEIKVATENTLRIDPFGHFAESPGVKYNRRMREGTKE